VKSDVGVNGRPIGKFRAVGRNGQVWKLYADDELAAELVVTGGDWPRLEARVEAHPARDSLRGTFAEEWAASEAEDWARADRLYAEIRAATRLVDPNGVVIPEYLLHIDGSDAWWRWAATPFEDEPNL
jgi:hypothetical protein